MERIAEKSYIIDSQFLGFPRLSAVYFLDAMRPTLIETSGALVAEHVLEELRSAGIDDLAYVVVTHIHLDHAGAAGDILEAFPGAKLVVHPLGAKHMADPTRLHRSAERVYGITAMKEEWGYLKPIPSEAIIAAEDESTIDLGDRKLRILFTPGHAKHHLSVFDTSEGALYLGDSAGVYVEESNYLTPSAPPPDLDPYLACRSLEKLRRLEPEIILFTHYGPSKDPSHLLEKAEKQYIDWLGVAERGYAKGLGAQEIASFFEEDLDLERSSLPSDVREKVDKLVPYQVQAEGYLTYLRRKDQEGDRK